MKVRKNIYDAISKMGVSELTLLYEQIKILEKIKAIPTERKQRFTIEQIHKMTGLSKSCWSDTVTDERTERL